jgi:Fe2+ or Zn2+ uptake regulation protein
MLRGAGLRVTRPRLAVLSVVHYQPHADTDWIITAVRKEFGRVSHQAVYDVLHALTAAGSVRRFQPSGSVARYEARVRDNHHHVVCRSCGAIADVDGALGDTACLTAPTSRATTSARPRSSTGVDARRVWRQRRPAAEGNQPSRGNGETGKRDRT